MAGEPRVKCITCGNWKPKAGNLWGICIMFHGRTFVPSFDEPAALYADDIFSGAEVRTWPTFACDGWREAM